MEGIFLGVMDIHEAKNHQLKLKERGVHVEFRTNGHTCTTGCKVTVEVWGRTEDEISLGEYFKEDYMKHMRGHMPDFDHLSEVFDPNQSHVTCQACGAKFSPAANECPDCGLCYG
jgi:ribosomal protein L40E